MSELASEPMSRRGGPGADRAEHSSDTTALLTHQARLLELLASGAPLATVLTGIAVALEELDPGSRCSILLLDGATLRHGAAPSLAPEYLRAIDGLRIGADAGSCGTSAYLGTAVVAEDVTTDPRWPRFRDLAGEHALRACWSVPIRGRAGVLGTFAVYHDRRHRPSAREQRLVERLSHLASVAIDHDRLFGALAHAEVARRAAEAASRAKTDFVAALGHELRTPLQAVAGFTELLRRLDLPAERRAVALAHIDAAGAHIRALVDDALDVARIEAGGLAPAPAAVDLDALVGDVLALLAPLAAAEGVTLARAGTTPGPAHADPRRCRQVLINLVTNAVRYNRPGGRVEVELAAGAGAVVVVVRDTGPGVAPEDLDRLFVPFDRLGADDDRGVGLGLPLARGLAEAMGGRLAVASTVGQGTAVTLTLPASGAG